MPNLDHLGTAEYNDVYEPSDDTYLFVDTLSAEAPELRQRKPALCVEIGSGSGCVITHLASVLEAGSAACIATDVNPKAAVVTASTASANSQRIDPVLADLLLSFRPGTIDVLVFNPPCAAGRVLRGTSPVHTTVRPPTGPISSLLAPPCPSPTRRRRPSQLRPHLPGGAG